METKELGNQQPDPLMVKSIVLKAEWHWGSDSSVINDPLGKPERTPFFRVGLHGR
jgi:hypothetical protein